MIKIKDLKFQYAGTDFYALNGITLEIPRGKFIAILGHNGSGKSTLSKLLVGLYKPSEGSIEIDGIEMTKRNLSKIRRKISMVFQNPENQFIGATVEDDIAFGLENKLLKKQEMKETVQKFAQRVGMEKYLSHEPTSLSGGQKQRVAIASTLALDPDIIIFDEVTSMLDPKGKMEVLEIISEIQKEGKRTLISVTHDMDEAILADMVVVFSGGKLVAAGNPAEILNDKEITDLAKIEAPFIYKIAKRLRDEGVDVKQTYNRDELVGDLCK